MQMAVKIQASEPKNSSMVSSRANYSETSCDISVCFPLEDWILAWHADVPRKTCWATGKVPAAFIAGTHLFAGEVLLHHWVLNAAHYLETKVKQTNQLDSTCKTLHFGMAPLKNCCWSWSCHPANNHLQKSLKSEETSDWPLGARSCFLLSPHKIFKCHHSEMVLSSW